MKTTLRITLLFSCALLFSACAPEKPDFTSTEEMSGLEEQSQSGQLLTLFGGGDYQGPKNQSKGYYSRGSLKNPSLLPMEGFGFVKIARPRDFGYGSFDLVEILKETAAKLQRRYPSRDRLMIADLSRNRGGSLPGHESHQNGLDVDVGFIRLNESEQDPEAITGFEEHFVQNGELTANFDLRRNWHYAKLLARTGRVQRIFVGAAVKKGLCAFAKKMGESEIEKETLRRLRVIAGHTDHFHIRVTCPQNSPGCVAQQEVEEGPGC